MKKILSRRRSLVALVAVTMLSVGLSGTAEATASGRVLLNTYGFSVGTKSYTFPGGYLEHRIEGPGRTANSQRGAVTQASTICYGRISFTERGAGDKLLKSSSGTTVQGCLAGSQARTRYNYTFSSTTRKACTSLYLNEVYRNAACLAIS